LKNEEKEVQEKAAGKKLTVVKEYDSEGEGEG